MNREQGNRLSDMRIRMPEEEEKMEEEVDSMVREAAEEEDEETEVEEEVEVEETTTNTRKRRHLGEISKLLLIEARDSLASKAVRRSWLQFYASFPSLSRKSWTNKSLEENLHTPGTNFTKCISFSPVWTLTGSASSILSSTLEWLLPPKPKCRVS